MTTQLRSATSASEVLFLSPPAPRAFSALLDEIRNHVQARATLREALLDVLTLGGRKAVDRALAALTAEQRAVLVVAGNNRLGRTPSGLGPDDGGETWSIGAYPHGRILFARRPDLAAEEWAFCHIGPTQLALARERADYDLVLEAPFEQQASSFLAALDADGLRRCLRGVRDAIDHIDPVLFYVRDRTYTNFDEYNNLLAKRPEQAGDFLLVSLEERPLALWSDEERALIFCLHCLTAARIRCEAFNGAQLTPAALQRFFAAKYDQYAAAIRKRSAPPVRILDMAFGLAERRAEVRRTHVFYRSVHGLDFHKEERLMPRAGSLPAFEDVPPELVARLTAHSGVMAERDESIDEWLQRVVFASAPRQTEEHPDDTVGGLLEVVLAVAREALDSDVVMTRGLRNLSSMADALASQEHAAICGWPIDRYFCAVMPSARFIQQVGSSVVKVLLAISKRMQFNGWHYMPGHVPESAVPKDRHFYYPPRMTDTAEWSDQHHQGHQLAMVRYSIRSPASLEVAGRKLPGMCDIRAMRTDGAPYTLEEMRLARRLTGVVRAIHQATLRLYEERGVQLVVSGFDRPYYEARYGVDAGGPGR